MIVMAIERQFCRSISLSIALNMEMQHNIIYQSVSQRLGIGMNFGCEYSWSFGSFKNYALPGQSSSYPVMTAFLNAGQFWKPSAE